MICPYCETRNAVNASICAHCGIILKDAKSRMRPEKKFSFRSLIAPILIYATIGILVGIVGMYAGRELVGKDDLALQRAGALRGLGVGFVVGIAIVYLVSAGRLLLYNILYRQRANRLSGQLRQREAKVKKDLEALTKDKPAQAHILRGIEQLLQGELDTSIQQFEQAQRMGLVTAELVNAQGVALARRGSLDVAVDRFRRVTAQQAKEAAPRINLASALLRSRDGSLAEKAVTELSEVVRLNGDNLPNLLRLCVALIQAGRSAEAIEKLQGKLEQAPKEIVADLRNVLGVAQAAEGHLKEAADEFRAALISDPGHSHAMANIGVVNILQEHTIDAVVQLGEAVHVDPSQGKAHCDYGCALIADGALNEGIRELREAVVQDPTLVEAQFNIGKVYADNGLYNHAERYWTTVLKINPKLWQACIGMGVMHFHIGPADRALAWFKEAERLAPNEAMVVAGLALCTALQGDLHEAERLFQRAIELDPNQPDALCNLSWIYIQLENHDKAAEYAERAIKANRSLASAYNNLALCNIHMSAIELAVVNFRKANELDPKLKGIHYNIGHLQYAMKNLAGAVNEWRLAAEDEPNYADAHTNLGVGFYRQANFEGAVNCFKRVIVLRQDRMEDYANLGLAYARSKRHKEAIEQFDIAIQMEPNNPMLHSNRGLACFFAKEVEQAMREWRVVAQLSDAYFKTRSSKQQSEFDESNVDVVPLRITERATHSEPRTGSFLYAMLPGFSVDRWELLVSDETLKEMDILKDQYAAVNRSLRALKLS
ncbi:MAG: tetratricopeptide repeat protein [Capsulimonadaceae bacterium]|nr:tetratricopeptide repeat protein [Capsulimonadaceae bacterium]